MGRNANLSISLSSAHHFFQWFTWRAGQLTGNQLFDFQGELISIVFKQIGPPRELLCPVCVLHAVSRWGENLLSIEGVNSNRGTRFPRSITLPMGPQKPSRTSCSTAFARVFVMKAKPPRKLVESSSSQQAAQGFFYRHDGRTFVRPTYRTSATFRTLRPSFTCVVVRQNVARATLQRLLSTWHIVFGLK
jgi:hypothetical protein